jgi:molybdenum cofactor synthesis domain-containing protein
MNGSAEAKVETIAVGEKEGAPKLTVGAAHFCRDHGIDGDAKAALEHRQVSLLARETSDALESDAAPARETQPSLTTNLVVSGLNLQSLGLGSQLRLGSKVLLAVTELEEGFRKDAGLYARVLEEGTVTVGDAVRVVQRIDRSAFQIVVLTLSDRGFRAETADTAGPAAAELIKTAMDAHVYRAEILPDDRQVLAARLRHYADGHGIDLILTVGGTGFSPRDVTPEAVRDVVERLTPGLDEAMRAASLAVTPWSMLSRACSGIRGQTLIVSLPGSRRAAIENLQAILAALPHGLAKLRGDGSDCVPRPAP